MSATIRLLVVDDHAVVRQGLKAYIEELDDLEVGREAASGEEAIEALEEMFEAGEPPDVVLLDLILPGIDGVKTTAEIKQRHPEVEVVIMTSFGEPERVRRALDVGAAGYLLKDAEPDEVEMAIRAALAGELHLDSAVARSLAQTMLAQGEIVEPLSPREREVLALLGRGHSNQQIADELVISERTARTHVSSILFKLNLSSRTQAALWAIKNGIASLS